MKPKDNQLDYKTESKAAKKESDKDENSYLPTSPWINIKRELTQEDLNNPAVQRILLSENDKLEHKAHQLDKVLNEYHVIDKECSILREKLDNYSKFDIVYSISITIGSGLMGLSSIYWATDGYVIFLIGLVLTLAGIAVKIFKK